MRQRDRVTGVAAAVAIAAAVLVIGGAPRWSLAALAVPVVVAIGAQLTSRRGLERMSPILALLGIAFGLTVIQAVPLPSSVQASLAPTSHELIEEGHELLGDAPAKLMPLSVDPPATRRAALDLGLALALAWVLLRIAPSQQGRYTILATVAGVCGLAAAIGAVDTLLDASSLYGLYTPHRATPTILGPLLNPNSYGSLLVLGAMVSAGLALHGSQTVGLRAAWACNVVLCLVVAFATLSRGAALAAGIGTVTTAVMWLSGRKQQEGRRKKPQLLRVTVPAAVVVVCGLALVVLTSAGGVTKQIEETSVTAEYNDPLSKYAAWRSSEQLVRESPWIGVGRGAFESAFTRVHAESAFGTFSHLENEYLQAVVDWGIPGAAALGVAATWLMLIAARRRREGALAAGAIGGLAAVAAQSTVDFGLELPGLLIPAVAVATTLAYVPLREMSPSRVRRAMGGRLAMIAVIVLGVAIVVPSWGATIAEDHDALVADDPPPTLDEARDAMRRHPLDYYAPARVAVLLFAKGDPSAIKHLNRALELHPTLPDLHRLAARILVATGHPAQAKLEYQIAMKYTQTPLKLIGEILASFPNADDAANALWIDFPNAEAMAHDLQTWKRPDVALRYLRLLIAHQKAMKRGPEVQTLDLLEQIAIDQNDLDTAEQAARDRLARDGGILSRLGLGKVLRKRGKAAEAQQVLSVQVQGPPDQVNAAHLLLCDVVIDQKAWADAEQCLRKMMESSNLTVPMLREVHGRLATIAEQRGDPHRAQMEKTILQGLAQ
jgi:hypothetical protein